MNPTEAVTVERSDDSRHYARGIVCPRCQRTAYRIPRSFMDLFLNLFVSIHRYRCASMSCIWEGNVRVKRASGCGSRTN